MLHKVAPVILNSQVDLAEHHSIVKSQIALRDSRIFFFSKDILRN